MFKIFFVLRFMLLEKCYKLIFLNCRRRDWILGWFLATIRQIYYPISTYFQCSVAWSGSGSCSLLECFLPKKIFFVCTFPSFFYYFPSVVGTFKSVFNNNKL
jgi:hypothetical protein